MSNAPPPDSASSADLTTILKSWRDGNDGAFDTLVERVYAQLKVMAAGRLQQMDRNSTLSPTDLLHEALIGIMPTEMAFENRAHFFATVSLAIRSVLVDYARARSASKRGGDLVRVTLTNLDVPDSTSTFDLLAIDEALGQLEALDPRCGQIMHLSYFAGLSQPEIAAVLNISLSTVTRDLRFAHGWFAKKLKHGT